jgi:hypothetical protein
MMDAWLNRCRIVLCGESRELKEKPRFVWISGSEVIVLSHNSRRLWGKFKRLAIVSPM